MATLRNKCKSYVEQCVPKGIPFGTQNKLTSKSDRNYCVIFLKIFFILIYLLLS
jgi:hypothetical protein